MSADSWQALWLTFKLASLTSIILVVLAIPISWCLMRVSGGLRALLQACIALPLVLPPTVLGFYLLLLFSPQSVTGRWLEQLSGSSLAFSFSGILIGSLIYSLPFAVHPVYQGFSNIDKRHLESARMLGLPGFATLWHVVLPLAKSGIVTALGLVFAHTLGEFGVILMIGGNIPGETRVLSVALFDQVESLQFQQAHILSAVMLSTALIIVGALYWLNQRRNW